MMDTSDEWIRERTGIERRHIAGKDETTASLSLIAAQRALEMAGIDAEELDMIVVGTCTPDKIIPSVATIVQRRLGIKGCPALDVNAACSGFLYGLDYANRYFAS
jgi:3-oxoacyl-[acyl-carrier-protein] synthase-3